MLNRIPALIGINILIISLATGCSPAAAPENDPTAAPSPVPVTAIAPVSVGLELVVDGLNEPDLLISPPDGSHRRFIKDQNGTIHILTPDGQLLATPFLDVTERLVENPSGAQSAFQGLTGFVFHPEFSTNGRFYVYYTAKPPEDAGGDVAFTNVISEFRVSSSDPNRADMDSERVVLEIEQSNLAAFAGGAMVFGPQDSYLYIAVGTDNIAATLNPETLTGKVLRIDVDGGDPYAIPADNPFLEASMPDEVYSLGIRNGWRMSVDPLRREIYVVDERFSFAWAEVNLVAPGADFGWQAQVGRNCFTSDPTVMLDNCLKGRSGEVLAAPIVEYSSTIGVIMSGAVMYRGSAIPDLQGKLIVIDSGVTSGSGGHQGTLLAASPQPAGTGWLWPHTQLHVTIPDETARYFWSLGQDADGEIYLTTIQVFGGGRNADGKVFKIVPAP